MFIKLVISSNPPQRKVNYVYCKATVVNCLKYIVCSLDSKRNKTYCDYSNHKPLVDDA